MNAAPIPGVTSLYRHFDADGVLLYVGVSLSWPARTKQHASGSQWFAQVARVEIERFPTRQEALEAERKAIKVEKPKFNIIHNRGTERIRRHEAARRWIAQSNPLLREIQGPHAIVGPALMYRGDTISVLVAHGTFGAPGEITELVLGERFPDIPEWTDICASVITIRRPNEITLAEAQCKRSSIIASLRLVLKIVQAFDTDLALATAYATQFPSDESRRVLDQVAKERCR